jgi:hypothetical protein
VLPQIKAFLTAHDLRFLGFVVDGAVITRYRQRFPEDPAATDLDRWDTFEAEHPAMFGRMYQFWVQKAGPGTSPVADPFKHSGQTVSARPLAPRR